MATTIHDQPKSGPSEVPGGDAEKPQDVPARGWLQIAKRGWAEAKADQVPLLAAGVAFYAFLAIFPAMVALVFLYGLVADPATIATQVGQVTQALPEAARTLITDQLTTLGANNTGAGVGALVSVLLALWSASGGVGNLMTAISTAYDEEETRSFIKKRGLALLLTVGAIIFMVIMLALVAALPIVLQLFDNGLVRFALQAARWVLLVVVIAGALAILYRVAPDRDAPKMRWTSVGAGVATLLWLVASIGFSVYAGQGGYQKTYGAVAGFVILLFWLWITSYAILLGAEINAESEQQTVKDTTKGPTQPLGQRGAVKADSVPDGETTGAADGHETRPDGDQQDRDQQDRDQQDRDQQDQDQDRDRHDGDRPHDDQPSKETSMSTSSPTPQRDGSPTVAELVRQMSEDSSHLIRSEMKLAQAEFTAKAKDLGIGVGAFGAAGVLALFGVGVLITTAILALHLVLPAWLAALIVGVVVLAVAGVAALIGKKKVQEGAPPVPTEAIDSMKTDVSEIKESAKR